MLTNKFFTAYDSRSAQSMTGSDLKRDELLGPRLKIERGYLHINDARTAIAAYLDRQPYIMVVELSEDKTRRLVKARRVHELPQMTSIVIADAIHNLRSALDLLAVCMARKNRIATTAGINFPFGRSKEAFEVAVGKAEIKTAFGPALELVKELKPYRGGNHQLWALHDLDRRNKHIAINPVATVSLGHSASAIFQPGTTETLTFSAPRSLNVLDQETVILDAPNVGSDLQLEGQITTDIAFGDVEAVKGQSVVATLENFGRLTTRIFSEFEVRFFS